MAKAVVATPEAAEGIRTQDEAALQVAQGASAFAEKIIALLTGDAAQPIGAAARACVLRDYAWEAHLTRLDQSLSGPSAHAAVSLQEVAA